MANHVDMRARGIRNAQFTIVGGEPAIVATLPRGRRGARRVVQKVTIPQMAKLMELRALARAERSLV